MNKAIGFDHEDNHQLINLEYFSSNLTLTLVSSLISKYLPISDKKMIFLHKITNNNQNKC